MFNAVYWAEPERLAHNNEALQVAGLHRLELGTEIVGIVAALDGF